MRKSPKLPIGVLGLASLLVLAGCKVGPKYARPQVPAPPAFRGADDAAVATDAKDSIGDQQWSQVFKEPELQALITKALQNNYDVRIAAQRVLEQQAQVKITRAQQFPTISAGGSGIGAYAPGLSSLTGGDSNSNDGSISVGSFNLSAAWTPDFWGLYRRQTEAARDTLLAQEWARKAVRLTLVQQVATTYFTLRALDSQLAIAEQTVKSRQDSVDLTRRLADGGSVPLSDLRQAEQLLYTATSQIPQLKQQIQQNENALQLLLGETPGSVAHTDPNALLPPPANLPVGVPSQLLERRPDVQQSEAQLMAANANIGVARAQFFPQLSISASGGVGGDNFPDMFKSGAETVYGIGSLAQPLFAGGKLRGQLQIAQETKKELVLNYQKTILTAFRDVSNALIAADKQRAYREQQEKLVVAAQDATRLARIRYQGGATAYLEVLTTDTNLFQAQLNLALAQQNEALSLVQLYAALGGGWQ
ncbi:MAG TPA: efflux transporter outer membrane subunit [Edaphobacter sp.]